jgi:hypothetical protein
MSSYLKLLSKMFNKYPFMVKYHKVFSLIVLFTFFVLIFSSIAAAWGSDIYATPISGHYCGNGFVYGTATFPTYYPYEWWGCNY